MALHPTRWGGWAGLVAGVVFLLAGIRMSVEREGAVTMRPREGKYVRLSPRVGIA